MKKLFQEPLIHFLLLGALLFGAYAWRNRSVPGEVRAGQVLISERDVVWLKETWAKQWQREPDQDELRGLVTEFLKEELLAREAREMGLDQEDVYVRRRLAQKMEFLVQDTSRLAVPTEDDLRRFYSAHPERFSEPAMISFTQIYFSREARTNAAADARAALAQLNRGSATNGSLAAPQLGDRFMLDSEFHEADPAAVAGQFGVKFAEAVFGLPLNTWHGPVESGYGVHLVRLTAQTPARLRDFAAVRTQVLDRWQEQRQREDNQKYFASLLKKYDVVFDASVKPLVGTLGESEVTP
jgi:hypothetical protein